MASFCDGSLSYYLELIHLEIPSNNFVQIRQLFTLLIHAFQENLGIQSQIQSFLLESPLIVDILMLFSGLELGLLLHFIQTIRELSQLKTFVEIFITNGTLMRLKRNPSLKSRLRFFASSFIY
jgi:uncharacterized membrane protein SirB2